MNLIMVDGLTLDDVTENWEPYIEENGTTHWTQLCEKHASLAPDKGLSDGGSGICGCFGCDKESSYYYDFNIGHK